MRHFALLSLAGVAIAIGCGVALDGDRSAGPRTVGAYSPSERLIQPPQPPALVARSDADVQPIARAASPERLVQLADRNGSVRYEGAQLPFFFESELGQSFLKSGAGRAIAQGAPRESCPAFGVALGADSVPAAVETALNGCLDELSLTAAPSDCGCRLLAAGSVLLDETDAYAYARAIHVRLIDPKRGLQTSLIAEERAPRLLESGPASDKRIAELTHGARSVWLLSPSGPFASLELKANGAAEMTIVEGPPEALSAVRQLNGRWSAEGFRRGRLAKTVVLTDADGDELTLLIGYEPDELDVRGDALAAAADALRGPSSAERAAQ